MALISAAVSLASGIGVVLAVSALIISGVSAIEGVLRYAWTTGGVVSLNLCCISVLPQVQSLSAQDLLLIVGIPYTITFLLIGVGLIRLKRKTTGL